MPPKKKSKVNRADKEKPLLTVQGVLRLDKSFVPPRNEDAPELVIKRNEDADQEVVRLVPGRSEHDLVHYELGYDVGPANPFPINEPEKVFFEERQKVEAINEAFEELKRKSEEEKKALMEKFKQKHGLKGKDEVKPEDVDPDNPQNYFPPEEFEASEPSSSHRTVTFAEDVAPPGDDDASSMPSVQDYASPENNAINPELVPAMKPLPDELQFGPEMVLSVALEMEEKRRKRDEALKALVEEAQDDDDDDKDDDRVIYSLDEMTMFEKREEQVHKGQMQGPEISEVEMVQSAAQQQDYNAKLLLETYWSFVRENPRDFNGWTYLLQHVETIDIVEEIRTAYNAFLPLYPYCYAYWMRYSDIEKRHNNWSRALTILHRGLEAIPLSTDLWLTYLELYYKMYHGSNDFDTLFSSQCERAIQTVGLDFKSDTFWERIIEWELDRKNYRNITSIFRRLAAIPTKLYNRHWDSFIAHVRDHHPRDILDYEEYEELRRVTCDELGLKYRPDPISHPEQKRDVQFPEDKLKAGMKERIVATLVGLHEKCEAEVEKRLKFEDKIKRSYFHVKPLDLKQLKNWESYLDFEIEQGNHERIVVLFERCLIPAASYEQFWAKYARYLELHAKETELKNPYDNHVHKTSTDKSPLKKARLYFSTGLNAVEKIREKRCTWTVRGWKQLDKDGNEIMVGEEISVEKENNKDKDVEQNEENTVPANGKVVDSIDAATEDVDKVFEKEIELEMSGICKASRLSEGRDAVRDVFRRACVVHCPNKAMIRMKWAAFEEEAGDIDAAKNILIELNKKYPLLLECCMQLADIERRSGNLEKAEDIYKKLLKRIPQNRKHIKTWVSLKLARFQFKVWSQPDKALATLRTAVKKERGDPRLYSQIIDICYQRHPVDVPGVTAAIELALVSNELSNMQKLEFVKRKVEFMQEFGDIRRYRDACEQLKNFRKLCSIDLRAEAKKKKEFEKEEQKMKELEEFKLQMRANANLKAKIAETEGRLLCTQCQASMLPDDEGEYEFERPLPRRRCRSFGRDEIDHSGPSGGGATTSNDADDDVIDLMDLEIPEEEEEKIKQTLQEKTKYKEVAPTWELNIETYGYNKRRKIYDPDYEHVESAKFREYERLEVQGYEEELKDPNRDKIRHLNAPGLGSEALNKDSNGENRFTESDYIVPPKVPQLQIGPIRRGPEEVPGKAGEAAKPTTFELPKEIADPTKSPCVNVPDWFVKEGGELCLSDTNNGTSIIRYWPKFLSEKGNTLMFSRLRKYCKWHQKQVKIGGDWKYETRLIAWYGPCDYNYSGLTLEKNLNWAPELLDLLHRLIAMTRHEFNSCFMNLYRHGHDMCGWHADVHPQLGRNPPVASISLGAVRVFEFRKKSGPPNFIRFPLFPGSLLLMEGATQEDWLHCLPRDPTCKDERINLTFRTMYSIDKR